MCTCFVNNSSKVGVETRCEAALDAAETGVRRTGALSICEFCSEAGTPRISILLILRVTNSDSIVSLQSRHWYVNRKKSESNNNCFVSYYLKNINKSRINKTFFAVTTKWFSIFRSIIFGDIGNNNDISHSYFRLQLEP